MRRCLTMLLVVLGSVVDAQQPSVPEIPYESVPDFLKLPPDRYLGEVASVALNSKKQIFVYTRNGNNGNTQLLKFGPDGKFLQQIGKDLYGFYFAEKVRVDRDDNIWAVDGGTNMVIKFSPEGRVLMLLGRKWELYSGVALNGDATPLYLSGEGKFPPAVPRNNAFNRPTDVAWDSAGNIFISDGHTNFGGNARFAKIDKDGNWIKSFGQPGKAPGEFNTPHTIAIDAKGSVYVGDRGNNRIQVFDTEGNFVKMFTNVGAPFAICITPGPNQVMYSADSSRIYKLDLNGNLLGAFGKSGKLLGQFGLIHGIACPSENEVYVAELTNWRVQKLILRPTPAGGR